MIWLLAAVQVLQGVALMWLWGSRCRHSWREWVPTPSGGMARGCKHCTATRYRPPYHSVP